MINLYRERGRERAKVQWRRVMRDTGEVGEDKRQVKRGEQKKDTLHRLKDIKRKRGRERVRE